MPLLPTVIIGIVVVVLAFVIGRATAGGDDEPSAAVNVSALQQTTTTAGQLTHTVKPGESLLGIASQYGVTAEAIAYINGLPNQNYVFVGQVLKIPETSFGTQVTTTTTTKPKG